MKSPKLLLLIIAVASVSVPVLAASSAVSQDQALVTILPKSGPDLSHATLSPENLHLKINGKTAAVTSVTHARGAESPLELVFLIDDAAHRSIGTQLSSIRDFANELPANAEMAIAYMQNGRAVFSGPLSSDPKKIVAGLRIPAGPAGISGSPYFCLSDLAKHWPFSNPNARREVILISDGIDNYSPRFDPDDPYVQAAINDSVRAGLTVYSIYWTSEGRLSQTRFFASGGQSSLLQLTDATGGYSYWQGMGNPVSFDAYFKDIRSRFEHQYRIQFETVTRNRPEVLSMNLKLSGMEAHLSAPQKVAVGPHSGD